MPDTPLRATPGIEPNWEDLSEETWTRVEGGSLDAPVYVRLGRTSDGRSIVNGLVMGASWPRDEITANVLRQIRIGEILRSVFDGWSLTDPEDLEELADQVTSGILHETLARRAQPIPAVSRIGSRSVPDVELEEFARIYKAMLVLYPSRAMTETAKTLGHMSRSTANRWAEKCRQRGLLPPREAS